jgi:hypothetical protein
MKRTNPDSAKIRHIASKWVEWNAKVITTEGFALAIQSIIPIETEDAWKFYVQSKIDPNNPLRKLLVKEP